MLSLPRSAAAASAPSNVATTAGRGDPVPTDQIDADREDDDLKRLGRTEIAEDPCEEKDHDDGDHEREHPPCGAKQKDDHRQVDRDAHDERKRARGAHERRGPGKEAERPVGEHQILSEAQPLVRGLVKAHLPRHIHREGRERTERPRQRDDDQRDDRDQWPARAAQALPDPGPSRRGRIRGRRRRRLLGVDAHAGRRA